MQNIHTNRLPLLLITLLSCSFTLKAQHKRENIEVQKDTPLFLQLKTCDSLLFDIGFNECNLEIFDTLVADDFEFYHDQSGITPNKAEFINGTKNGLCKMDYRAIRKLEPGTLTVFPMYKDGKLYGALQSGYHSFYALYPGKTELVHTSEAYFTHLWLLEDSRWKLARVLSYDHKSKSE